MKSIKTEKTMTINRSTEELYRFWHDFANLPRFTKHFQEVSVRDSKRSHWVMAGPLDTHVEWDAEIIQDRENELITWASLEGADIGNSGFVEFKPLSHDRGTAVTVGIKYDLPAGRVGDAIAKLFGESPEQQIEDDLRRFKMLMETGEIATTEGQPRGHS
ncbi:MAG: hypothetical protein RLZZ171_2671 [Cyanobacteriota bacterium]|jgi:uncharacterized membrane protein